MKLMKMLSTGHGLMFGQVGRAHVCYELERYKEEKKSSVIYTDPKDPSESIIDKRLSTLWYSFTVLCYVVQLTHLYVHYASDRASDKDGLLIQFFLLVSIPLLSVFWVIFTYVAESSLDALLACGVSYLSTEYIAAGARLRSRIVTECSSMVSLLR